MDAPSKPQPRPFLRIAQGLAVLALAAFTLHAGFGLGGAGTDGLFNDYVYNGLMALAAASCLLRAVRIREARPAWTILGLGLAAWTSAEIYNSLVLAKLEEPPYPSLSDYLWLTFYPASYVAMVLLVRGHMRKARTSMWLDGVVAALAVCAIGEVTVFHTVAENAIVGDNAALATDLAYPAGDMMMLAIVATVFALTAWRPGRAWGMIGLGLAAAGIADSIYVYQSASGTYEVGTALDALWLAATLLVGFAAWERTGRRNEIRLDGWRILVLPIAFALPTLGLLVYDHYEPIDDSAVLLAAMTLLAVIARTAMTFGENMRMLKSSQREALTDALTGLGNRRRLMLELHEELEGARGSRPRALVLFDLDGFKRYNDNFGHPAGDALLARLGRNLAAAVSPRGRAYRLGGDEFCALVRADDGGAGSVIAAGIEALSEQGQGFSVSASHGVVLLPEEADDPSAAMQIADQRLYGNKGTRQATAIGEQTRDVLMQALQERQPDLHEHLHEVSELALAVGRRMGLTAERLDELARAAELHDVGKMAVPDEILNKPGPLDGVEMSLIHQHTVVGERILAAAPALTEVARLVRSSHENWDGSGYPDGLAGEEIPVGSRVIAVCDAYHAMTSDRPYQDAVAPDAALTELERCAGTHFDPRAVAVLREVVHAGPAPAPELDMPTLAVPSPDAAAREYPGRY